MDFSGKRILIADDESEIRFLLGDFFASSGFEVNCVCDGQQALEVLETEKFDVAVIDLAMPKVNGIEVVRRGREKRPDTGFVIITGYASGRAIMEAMSAGAVRFLPKPFMLDDLMAAVNAALQARPGEVGAAGPALDVRSRGDWVEVTAPSQKEYRDRLEHLFETLAGQDLPRAVLNDIRIALGEIVSNAMEWGNRHQLDKPVRVSYCLFPDEVVFRIEDLGPGFDPSEVPDPLATPDAPLDLAREREAQGKRPGGFGLAIARNVMDQIIYNGIGNSVVMSKRLSGGG
jgi:DNA-binding response OmpR family regulator